MPTATPASQTSDGASVVEMPVLGRGGAWAGGGWAAAAEMRWLRCCGWGAGDGVLVLGCSGLGAVAAGAICRRSPGPAHAGSLAHEGLLLWA